MNEFELIRRHFAELTPPRADLLLGIGDDCALLQPPPGEALAVTTDTLIAGRHFPLDAAPFDIGWKALAVNLSDLAAMGAQPRWFTLALSLPQAGDDWLSAFADGLRACAKPSGIALAGGDTTRGTLSITITCIGTTDAPQGMRRSGAQAGDVVCVTGTLGDAALGLRLWQQRSAAAAPDADRDYLFARLHRPQARVHAGLLLREVAHAAIDLSDGLAGDLQHVLDASGVGAEVWPQRLPMSVAFERLFMNQPLIASPSGRGRRAAPGDGRAVRKNGSLLGARSLTPAPLPEGGGLDTVSRSAGAGGAAPACTPAPTVPDAVSCAQGFSERFALQASGGDDYELCVCLPADRVTEVSAKLDLPLTEIGRITDQPGLRWRDADNRRIEVETAGYQHFP